jgi:murein DD-endopeptidase MepM/ murein hydrolase activator NlpD
MIIDAPIRGNDSQGSGEFGAPRGNHTHRGIDIACYKGSLVKSVCAGRVTKVGFPYNPRDPKKGHLRYVQVTDINGYEVRYFYVKAHVLVGKEVKEFEVLGETQGLEAVYPGITDHFHFEVKLNNNIVNPDEYLLTLHDL